jgi:hypothetical protein
VISCLYPAEVVLCRAQTRHFHFFVTRDACLPARTDFWEYPLFYSGLDEVYIALMLVTQSANQPGFVIGCSVKSLYLDFNSPCHYSIGDTLKRRFALIPPSCWSDTTSPSGFWMLFLCRGYGIAPLLYCRPDQWFATTSKKKEDHQRWFLAQKLK